VASAAAPAAPEIDLRAKWPAIALIGLATGVVSGLLGIGGAAVLVPGLVDVLGVSQHRASGTSLFVIVPTAFVSAVVYALSAQTDWGLVVLFSVTAMLGATVGARVMTRVSALNLRRLFGVFLLFVAIRLVVPGATSPTGVSHVHVLAQNPAITAAEGLLGLFAGFLSGLLGIGGGQVLTPGMVFLFDVPQKVAQGISITFIVPTALSGAYTHYRRGNVLPGVGILLVPCSVVGGVLGAWGAQHAAPQLLRVGFGLFLLYGSTRMLAPRLVTRLLRRVGRGA
jgi:uncharacterized membrane protein YfcA